MKRSASSEHLVSWKDDKTLELSDNSTAAHTRNTVKCHKGNGVKFADLVKYMYCRPV